MQSKKTDTRGGRKEEIPCKSMPNLLYDPQCEGESSLNPYALEFVPSYLKSRNQKMKTEATSTTTLPQRDFVGDASYLHAQRQLFELLHQLGDKFMPLKAIKVSLAPDGQGINVQFKAEHGITDKQMLDESLCQDAALHLEMSDRSFIPRRLPNVLAANFMVRMGDVLNDKMEWNEQSMYPNQSTDTPRPTEKRLAKAKSCSTGAKGILNSDATILPRELATAQLQKEPIHIKKARIMLARPSIASKLQLSIPKSSSESLQKTVTVNQETKHEKKSNTGIHTPRQSLGQIIKKGLTGNQKCAPRSTHTSQMRQSQVQKRMGLQKTSN